MSDELDKVEAVPEAPPADKPAEVKVDASQAVLSAAVDSRLHGFIQLRK